MADTTTRAKLRWGLIDVIVVVFALVPVLWIASLSFKTPATLTDGKFWPRSGRSTTTGASSTPTSSSGPWSTRSASP